MKIAITDDENGHIALIDTKKTLTINMMGINWLAEWYNHSQKFRIQLEELEEIIKKAIQEDSELDKIRYDKIEHERVANERAEA